MGARVTATGGGGGLLMAGALSDTTGQAGNIVVALLTALRALQSGDVAATLTTASGETAIPLEARIASLFEAQGFGQISRILRSLLGFPPEGIFLGQGVPSPLIPILIPSEPPPLSDFFPTFDTPTPFLGQPQVDIIPPPIRIDDELVPAPAPPRPTSR